MIVTSSFQVVQAPGFEESPSQNSREGREHGQEVGREGLGGRFSERSSVLKNREMQCKRMWYVHIC